MLNFNKLRFVVFEIFDNSQLFLTDLRISILPLINMEITQNKYRLHTLPHKNP